MKNYILLIMSMVCPLILFGQNNQLPGKVVDANLGTPLKGANIQINNAIVAVSDEDGEFLITCRDSLHLKVSFIGYQTAYKSIFCTKNDSLIIYLHPSAQDLPAIEMFAAHQDDSSLIRQGYSTVELSKIHLSRTTGLFLGDRFKSWGILKKACVL